MAGTKVDTTGEGVMKERTSEEGATNNHKQSKPQQTENDEEFGLSEEEDDDDSSSTTSSDISTSSDDAGSSSDESNANNLKAPSPDLQSRLAAFLPQIAQANQTLSASERLDEVDEGEEQYIEMDLGLGVLSERPEGKEEVRAKESEDESGSDAGEGITDEELMRVVGGRVGSKGTRRGEEPAQKRRKIEEVS